MVRMKQIFYGFSNRIVSACTEAALLLEKANSELAEFSAPVSAYLDKPVVETEDFWETRGVIPDLHRCS